MYNNEFYHNDIAECEGENVMTADKTSKIDQAVNIVTKICEVINAIGNAMEGAQQIYTAKENFKTVHNSAKVQNIQSEIDKMKAMNRQSHIKSKYSKKR